MSTVSTNLGMILAEGPDTVDVTDHIANNFDSIDDTFATHTPTTQAVGNAAAMGSSLVVARGDHRHGMPAFGAPVALGTAIATGTSANINHSDHVHTIGAGTVDTASLASGLAVPLSKIDITGGTDIGAALADTDVFPVYDASAAANKKTAMTRVTTYLQGSDLIHGATAIGAALADADEFLVYDASATAQRTAAMTRINTYIQAAISGDVTISAGVSAIGASKVTSSMIVDGTIVNADINASAAIAVSKLAIGSALALLRTNSGATAAEWGTPGQIIFPAADAGSATNTLGDYEQGSFTAVLSTPGNATYTVNTGSYTKIGRVVAVNLLIIINAIGTGTNTSNINGLPFSAGDYGPMSVPYFISSATNFTELGAYITNSGSAFLMTDTASAVGSVTNSPAIWQNGTQVMIGGNYRI